jgi:hypothetical protein
VIDLRGFADGVRIAIKNDYGKGNDYRSMEERLNEMYTEKIKKEREVSELGSEGYKLEIKEGLTEDEKRQKDTIDTKLKYLRDELSEIGVSISKFYEKSKFDGMSSVCKIIMGKDTFYRKFRITDNSEPYGQKWIKRGSRGFWQHSSDVLILANLAEQSGVSKFSMEFSGRRITQRLAKIKKERERSKKEDERDRMEAEEVRVFLRKPLRW